MRNVAKKVSNLFVLAALTLATGFSVSANADSSGGLSDGSNGSIPTKPGAKSDRAEVCTAVDGKRQIVKPFGTDKVYYVEAPTDPRAKPQVKENFGYMKDAAGVATKSVIEPELFDFIAEPFGGVAIPKTVWAGTYETLFEGRVQIMDDRGTVLGTFVMKCNGALLEYN